MHGLSGMGYTWDIHYLLATDSGYRKHSLNKGYIKKTIVIVNRRPKIHSFTQTRLLMGEMI